MVDLEKSLPGQIDLSHYTHVDLLEELRWRYISRQNGLSIVSTEDIAAYLVQGSCLRDKT
jgi:hypothetical protein